MRKKNSINQNKKQVRLDEDELFCILSELQVQEPGNLILYRKVFECTFM